MKSVQDYVEKMPPENRVILESVFLHIEESFPQLKQEFKWNQPMYTHEGTFIIGFSVAKAHFSIAPEEETLNLFIPAILKAGYTHSKKLFRIKYTDVIHTDLLDDIIHHNIESKKGFKTFWR